MGPYDNEAGVYMDNPTIIQDWQWITDEAGNLYLVPPPGTVAEIEGDGPAGGIIAHLARVHGRIPQSILQMLSLYNVPPPLRRFTPEDGYYVA
jgi:hypothetical protein